MTACLGSDRQNKILQHSPKLLGKKMRRTPIAPKIKSAEEKKVTFLLVNSKSAAKEPAATLCYG